jgi:hypothetical protein
MKIFWENIIRYPKFLITSLAGLIFLVFDNLFGLLSLVFGNYSHEMKLNSKKIIILLGFLIFCLVFFFKIFLSI